MNNQTDEDRPMKYVFRIVLKNDAEERVGFIAESEELARRMAEKWCGTGATVYECCERWSVEA